MREEMPDLVVWRHSDDAVSDAFKKLSKLEGVIGFAVTQQNARFKVHDHQGNYLSDEARESDPVAPSCSAPVWEELDAHAKAVLKHPVRLAMSFPTIGAPMNLEANYSAIIDALLRIPKGEEETIPVRMDSVCIRPIHPERAAKLMKATAEQMVAVSCSTTGGGEAVYMDVTAVPERAQNTYLDSMECLKSGAVLNWAHYDWEMLRAAHSYRERDMMSWILTCAKSSMCVDELIMRLSMRSLEDKNKILQAALKEICHSIVHFSSEEGEGAEKGRAEEIEDYEDVRLPSLVLDVLG